MIKSEQSKVIKKSGKEFIREYLIGKIGKLKDTEPYIAFLMMSIGIEFLGKCLNKKKKWDTEDRSKKDFNLAIGRLKSLNKYQSWDLYHKLRCGLAHTMMVKSGLEIKDKGASTSTCVSCEGFYNDFKEACEEVMNMSLPVKNLDGDYLVIKEEDGASATGSTATNIVLRNK